MNILVLVKQIPEISKITFDPETGRIRREGVPLIMNSFDRRAVEEAIRIKERIGATVTVASMGPPQAADVLDDALRMGADNAVLITDRKFGGADTWATSSILSSYVKKINPDLVFAGKYSLDGETSQVPPQIAQFCNLNFISGVSKIELEDRLLRAEQEYENGIKFIETELPALISVSEKINRARRVDDSVPSMKEKIKTENSETLNCNIVGIENSLTVVEGTEVLHENRDTKFIDMKRALEILEEALNKNHSENDIQKTEVNKNKKNGMILGIGLGDGKTTREIASKINEIALEIACEIVIVGNVDPKDLSGMPANRYLHFKSEDIYSIADYIGNFIVSNKPNFVIFPSNSLGRDIAGMISAKLNLGLTADCVDIRWESGKLVQFKPAFGGGVVARITSKTKPEMATVRPGMFKETHSDESFPVEEILTRSSERIRILKEEKVESRLRQLQSSKIVIAIGRGIVGKAIVERVVEISEKLGIGVGGTRPIVDMKLLPRQHQVGITGLSISPDLYIALGVSGLDNHIMGIRYAKVVIGINKDPEAPIFHHADYGVVGDALEFVEMLHKYSDLKSQKQ